MRALILGGCGFIGSHLVDVVGRHGHEVRVFDRSPERYRAPVEGVEYVYGDFGNRGEVAEALEGADCVYHLVGTSLPESSNEDPVSDVETSVVRTVALLEECVARNVKEVVYVSSGGTVYGIPAALPVQENSATLPICSYGITRLCVEKYLEMFRYLHGLDYVVVRPSNAFGPRQNPDGAQGVIAVFIARMLDAQNITMWGDGSVVRDYIYVEDLVEGIYSASVAGARHRVFNLGSGHGVALSELVAVIERRLGSPASVDSTPGRAVDVPAVYLDITRAREELAWWPRTSLEDGIAATSEFLRACLRTQAAETTTPR